MAAPIRAAHSIAVCGHVHPDGDSLGSILALTHALKRLGKQVTPLLPAVDCKLREYAFMPGFCDLVPAAEYQETPDLFFSVDVPNSKRFGADALAVYERCQNRLALDHHSDTDMEIAALTYSDPACAACGMIVWDLIEALGLPQEPEEAMCCYVAVVTDTGRFQYQNTDARALGYATDFVLSGAIPSLIANNIYLSRSMARVQLEAICTQRLSFECDGKLVYSWICPQDYEAVGACPEDGEELADCVRSLAGANVCMLLRVQDNGIVRGSLRAKDDSDVASVAHDFNGGGHKAAAGFNFEGSLQECLDAVLPRLRELVR
ncbi:MAG: DHH family phosphoesterase [Coriobacteriales bacterium]|nr:DHH family phosphoesterase [Coriobacteriales bacterium]